MADRTSKVFCDDCYRDATHVLALDPGNPWGAVLAPLRHTVYSEWVFLRGSWDDITSCRQMDTPMARVRSLIGPRKPISQDRHVVVAIEGTYHGKAGRQQIASLNRKIGQFLGFCAEYPQFRCCVVFDPMKKNGIQWKRDMRVAGLSGRTGSIVRSQRAREIIAEPCMTVHQQDAVLMAGWVRDNVRYQRKVGGMR